MRVLILGSCGFLGSNLVDYIKKKYNDWEISGFDLIKKDNIDYDFEKLDFTKKQNWKEKINLIEPDLIFHLIGLFRGNNEELFNTNFNSFRGFIEGIKESKINSRLLIMGTSSQYGYVSEDENPIKETHPTNPFSFYGLTKNMQEQLTLFYNRVYGLDVICTRPSSFIGKDVSPQLLSGLLIQKFSKSSTSIEIEISNSDDIRDYIDIRDVCTALVKLQLNQGTSGEVFNISSNEQISNIGLIEKFREITNKKIQISYTNEEKNPLKIWLDNSKIREKCNFKPEYSLRESILYSLS